MNDYTNLLNKTTEKLSLFFFLFPLAIVFSVLLFTDSDYIFGIYKLFLCRSCLSLCLFVFDLRFLILKHICIQYIYILLGKRKKHKHINEKYVRHFFFNLIAHPYDFDWISKRFIYDNWFITSSYYRHFKHLCNF